MKRFFSDIGNLLTQLRLVDFLFIFLIILFMIVLISIIYFVKLGKCNDEFIEEIEENENKEFDLETVAKELEESESLNIKPNHYENEMEETAIISYDELIEHTGEYTLQYDDEYDSKTEEIEVKKIKGAISNNAPNDDIDYIKEENFLTKLKNLSNN